MTESEFLHNRLEQAQEWLKDPFLSAEDRRYLDGRVHELKWFMSDPKLMDILDDLEI